MHPEDPIAQNNFGNVLLDHGLADEAIPHFQKALELNPRLSEPHYKLGNAFSGQGRAAEAIGEYEKALHIRPDYFKACNNLAWILASNPDSSLRNGPMAVELASRADHLCAGTNPVILGTLAVAYAEVGKFSQAAATAQHALSLAGAESNSPLVAALRAQLALYRAGSPFRDTGP